MLKNCKACALERKEYGVKYCPEHYKQRNCENTDHIGAAKEVKIVKLTEDFNNDAADWCLSCRERDADMIEEVIN